MVPFAQLVIGPPGSGKSTYCDGMHQFMSAIGRPVSIVNLDPANDATSYPCALDVRNLVSLDSIMEEENLGPNGGVLYALEVVEKEFDWLKDGLEEIGDDYVIFDCPGQVELFTHHSSLRNIFLRLQKLGYRLTVVNCIDSFVLTQPSLYISALLLTLKSMLQLEFPAINVLTKIDNLHNYPELPFNLDFYTDVQELDFLLPYLAREQAGKPLIIDPDSISEEGFEESAEGKFTALNKAIVELVDGFSLVAYVPLAIEDREMMMTLLHTIDKASGYAFGASGANDRVWEVAMRDEGTRLDVRDVQERWIDRREEFDALEREQWKQEGEEWKKMGEEQARQMEEQEKRLNGETLIDDPDFATAGSRGMMGRDVGINIVRKPKT